jgi:outer membrane protein assembly factor BamB
MKGWLAAASAAVLAASAIGADKPLVWPQFRGPNGSGVADDQKPPIEFGPDKNVKWKVNCPSGFSSPIVAGDKLVLTAFEGGKLYTIAYTRADGKEAWRAEAPAKQIEGYHKTEGSPAASTPVSDGERVISYFGSSGLFCYDLTGKELWRFEMPMAVTFGDFGTGVSPTIVDGTVILVRDEMKDAKILALDAATGTRKWEKKRQCPSAFCTPVVWETATGKQIVAAGFGRMTGYDLKSGDEVWTFTGMPASCCSSPVIADRQLLYAGWSPGDPEDKEFKFPSFDEILKQAGEEKLGYLTKAGSDRTMIRGFFDNNDTNKDGKITREEWDANLKMMSVSRNSVFALKPGGTGEVTKSHVAWKKTKGMPYVPSGIAYRGQFIMAKDGGLLTAYDIETGKDDYVLERTLAAGRYYASPVAANGHIYFASLDDGVVTVLKAGSSKPEIVVKNPKLGERLAATPAIAEDRLYVRTAGHLYAFAEQK